MGDVTAAPMNEAAHFLGRLGPKKHAEYVAAFPELAESFASGAELGEEETAEARALTLRKAQAMLALLAEAATVCSSATGIARRRITISSHIKRFGQYASIVGGTSFVGALQLSDKTTTATIIGVLTTLAALASVIAEHLATGVGKDSTASTVYARLSGASAEIRLVSLELGAALETADDVSDATLRQLVGRANAVFRTVEEAGADIGVAKI